MKFCSRDNLSEMKLFSRPFRSNCGGPFKALLSICTRGNWPLMPFPVVTWVSAIARGTSAVFKIKSVGYLGTPVPKGTSTKSGKSMSIRERQAEGEGVGGREASASSQKAESRWLIYSPHCCLHTGQPGMFPAS